METLAENWFFVLVLLACIGVHFFGHGHGHGDGHGDDHGDDHGHGSPPDHRHGERESSEPR